MEKFEFSETETTPVIKPAPEIKPNVPEKEPFVPKRNPFQPKKPIIKPGTKTYS